jgi:hypothetical protein
VRSDAIVGVYKFATFNFLALGRYVLLLRDENLLLTTTLPHMNFSTVKAERWRFPGIYLVRLAADWVFSSHWKLRQQRKRAPRRVTGERVAPRHAG